jgi:excinuclease ABC subunit B
LLYVSATPGDYEYEQAGKAVEQIIRPTGLLDPEVEVRPIKGQIDDLYGEIQKRIAKNERVLVTTLTKKMSEDLTDYFKKLDLKVKYMHSEVHTLERMSLIRDFRKGVFDVLVGINLLREGLDLPEVSLVAILDADKEGFLRSETALVQTIGRAARNVDGKVIMYADVITRSMNAAIQETNRRRSIQSAYNEEHGITPQSIVKDIREVIEATVAAEEPSVYEADKIKSMNKRELKTYIAELEEEMYAASKLLQFERAAELRDMIVEIKAMMK